MITIGIDLGGTQIKLGLMQNGQILAFKFINTNPSHKTEEKLIVIEKEIIKLLNNKDIQIKQCAAVAFAFPGIVDPFNKTVISTNKKYDDAVNVDLNSWCHRAFNLPFIFENDANCALLGECYYGSAKGSENAVLMILGTGIGTAAIINGELLRGKHFQAGCLGGHLTIQLNGNKCTCGNLGCVEAEGSSWAIPHLVKKGSKFINSSFTSEELIDFKTVLSLKEAGDELATKIFNSLINVWSAGIVNLIHAYDPETVVLSGGIMNSYEKVLPLIKEKVLAHAWLPWGKPEFVVASKPDHSVLLGLDYLARKTVE